MSTSLSVVLSDGDTKKVDEKSIVLKMDGASVTPTTVRSGGSVTVTYTPAGVQFQQDKHTADLTFKDTTGTYTRNQAWTFYNLKNIVLPVPKILETFDTYPEDSIPTGWVASNFTSRLTDGRNIEDPNSESYENWVLVKTEHINAIDGPRPFNIAPGLLYNGKEIKNGDPVGGTFPEWLMSGNVLYAESDSRGNTDSLDRGYEGQTQFIVSKAFDCSQINDVVLTFSSIYEQNQDSLGAVEYSVDAGKTWMPIVYFLESPDIKVSGDGTVDALRTFNDPNTDTSNWKVGDVLKGDKYGDGIGAAITPALGPFITPRVNDGAVEGKRIEMFRLPQASKKSDVRLRFAQLGTDSWYFAVDNIAFYDVPTAPSTSVNLTDGLVAYWNFDGNLYDSIKSFHGTARGKVPVAFVDGQAGFGKALQLNGTNFVEITGSASTLQFASNSLSIAGWFKVGAFDKSWQALISKGENLNYRIARRSAQGNIAYAGGVGEGVDDVPAITNGWHHFVAVTDAKGVKFGTALYIDGVIRALNTNKAVLAAGTANLFIGENPESLNRQWNGQIDDLGLWNRVLTADEVTALYKGGTGLAISTLPGVNAPIGTTISRSGNNLTIQWSPAGGTLEFKNSVDPAAPWTTVGTANPATVTIGTGGGFYRVKK